MKQKHLYFIAILLVSLFLNGMAQAQSAKPTFVFIHGSPGSSEQFDKYVADPYLKKVGNFVNIQLPGFNDGNASRFQDHVQFSVNEIMKSQTPVILVGYSYGAVVALRASQLVADKVATLVLVSGVYNSKTIRTEWFLKPANWYGSQYYYPNTFNQAYHDTQHLAESIDWTLAGMNSVRSKLILVHGENDNLVPYQDTQIMSALKPKVFIRPGVGHDTLKNDFGFIRNLLYEIASGSDLNVNAQLKSAPPKTTEWQISTENLRTVIDYLADRKFKGRQAGTDENKQIQNYLVARLSELKLAPLGSVDGHFQQNILSKISGNPIGTNLIARIGSASAKDRCVLLGAHYDGQGLHDGKVLPSADDNASGVATVLEMARVLKAREDQLRRCVIIALWDHEEGSPIKTQGGIKGSRYWSENPTFPLDKIDLTLTFDLIGGNLFKSGAENLFFIIGGQSAPFLNYSQNLGLDVAQFNYDIIEPLGAKTARSDYTHFIKKQIPSLFLTTGTPWYYHSENDVIENINFRKQNLITRYALDLVWPVLSTRMVLAKAVTAFEFPSRQETEDMRDLLLRMTTSEDNFIDKDVIPDINDSVKIFSDKAAKGEPVPLCLRRKSFFDILQGAGGLKAAQASIGRALTNCTIRD